MMTTCRALIAALILGSASVPGHAEEILIAVASNFAAPMRELAAAFETETGHDVAMTFGASGRFVAQISNGAPFQIFFSADQAKPLALEDSGDSVSGTRFTYAVGSLVLWSANASLAVANAAAIRDGDYARLAIANPRLAPYGQAAVETLTSLGLETATRERLVQGENIAQTFQFVDSGNATLGFVAQSQVMRNGELERGAGWIVPTELHGPIRQDAVLLNPGADSPACREFLAFVRTPRAREIIANYGYRAPTPAL